MITNANSQDVDTVAGGVMNDLAFVGGRDSLTRHMSIEVERKGLLRKELDCPPPGLSLMASPPLDRSRGTIAPAAGGWVR